MNEAAKKKLAASISEMLTKAITTVDPDEETQEDSQPSVEDITKSVTEGVLAKLNENPLFKAVEAASTPQEPDEQAEMRKYVRRVVRKSVTEAVEIASGEIIKGVREQVMEMFGGEDSIDKVKMIGKKLKVVTKKKGQAPADEDDDEDGDEDEGEDESVQKKKFKKRDEGGRGRFSKKGSVDDLDKSLGDMARGALKK